jgi:hypothetical protein
MKYFFDNCISPKLPAMLRALGEDAIALRDAFPEGIKDVPLFEKIKGKNLVFISTDAKQLTREHEARALKQAGNTALFLGPFFEKMLLWDQAVWLVRRWPRISGFAEGVAPGTCAEIKQNGTALIYPL